MIDSIHCPEMVIRPYLTSDEAAVIALWADCRLLQPQNDPARDIARKMTVNPELFLVGSVDGILVASVMGGYEGHRGWINYLAVDPDYRKRGLGRMLMDAIEKRLIAMGCPKINLQVRKDNLSVVYFYQKLGFTTDEVVSLGKRLLEDKR